MIKKLLVFILVFLSISTSVFATGWEKLRTENDKVYYLQTPYSRNGKIVYCKIKQVPLWEGENRVIYSLKIDYNNLILYTQYTRYNSTWVPIQSYQMPTLYFNQISPNSALADAVVRIANYYDFKP